MVCMLSHVRLFANPWTATHQAPLSMGFSRQEYLSGCHFFLENPYIYGQLVLNKCSKTIQWGKNSLQQIVLGQLNTHVKE